MSNSKIIVDILYKNIATQVSVPRDVISEYTSLISSFTNELLKSGDNYTLISTPIELHSCFLKYCAGHDGSISKVSFHDFVDRFLCGKDIHIVCNELGLTKDQICTVLSGYFSVWILLPSDDRPLLSPALFTDDSAKLMLMFGGQGSSKSCLYDILFVYQAYHPLISDFIEHTSSFLKRVVLDLQLEDLYEYGLEFKVWLDDPESIPPSSYLLSSAIAAPLTEVFQLAQYFITFKTLGISSGELTNSFKAAVGHSHGIIAATAVSCSTTEESFYTNTEKALGISVLIGAYSQIDCPFNPLTNVSGCDMPHPMVLIKGLTYEQLDQLFVEFNNKYKCKGMAVCISVINTMLDFAVSGEITSTIAFTSLVRSKYASPGQDQSKVPYSQRKPVVITEYTNINVPYHCDIYTTTVDKQRQHAIDKGWSFNAKDMQITVRANDDGRDIRNEADLTRYLFQSVMVTQVNWPVVINHPDITHIIDFGSDGTNGFGLLAYRNTRGCGVSVICGSVHVSGNPDLGTKVDLYRSDLSSIVKAPNWTDQYSPTLVRTQFDNKIHISTKMSRLLGKPPIMVAGMTPTTVNENIVSSVLNSGYHIELACGGIHTRADLDAKINKLMESIEPGCGITLNLVYLNQDQWLFQFPAIIEFCKRGVPIEGLCIGGGVPSLDVATEIIRAIRDAGLRHIAFKPGSVETIYRTIDIARAFSNFPVMMQWTGGRGGGHHSFEDVHQPIISTYHSIRKQDNIVLVAGSGFGGSDDTFPYLTGEWSTCFGHKPMPFDGILLASRMMVAKESNAADSVKELIVAAPGTSDCDWEQTYAGPAGGVITIKSEFGEPIHVIANRCSLFWKELDNTVFSVPRKERLKVILDKRDYIIGHLNSDHTKPWFGTMPDGRIVDIEEMTYKEVVSRLADILYIKNEERWIHSSHTKLFNTLLLRIEERFTSTHGNSILVSIGLHNPHKQIECMLCEYPDTATQLITSEDVKYFVELCKQRGQKPVTFIPTLDESFETWFKKDTIWQSEDIACVPDQDPQRVLILQGPVAARYSTEINVTSKDILDSIYDSWIGKLVELRYNGDTGMVDSIGYLSNAPFPADIPKSIVYCESDSEREYVLRNDTPIFLDSSSWASILAGNQLNWLYALLESKYIIDDHKLVKNTLINILRPRSGHTVRVNIDNNSPSSVEVFNEQGLQVVAASLDSSKAISILINNHLKAGTVPLRLQYQYNPKYHHLPLVKLKNNSENSEAKFYRESVYLGTSGYFSYPQTVETDLSSSFSGFYIDQDHFTNYLKTLKCPSFAFKQGARDVFVVPAEYLFILTFPTIINCITKDRYCTKAMNMVHQSNSTHLVPNTRRICTGDTICSLSQIVSILDITSGKQMKVKTIINRDGEKVAEIVSSLVFRGVRSSPGESFSLTDTHPARVKIQEIKDLFILRSKDWFVPNLDTISFVCPGSVLQFLLKVQNNYGQRSPRFSSSTTGEVALVLANNTMLKVGDVVYRNNKTCANPVFEYLKQFGTHIDNPIYFKDGGSQLFAGSIEDNTFITAPPKCTRYSHASRDYTPIHTNPYIADYADLPATIIHGMHVSALTRSLIDKYAAGNHPERIVSYDVTFGEMVLPRDKLIPSFDHIGMKNGMMLIKGKTVNQRGDTVLEFTAEVEQPPTVYLFTGQGPQHVGMGMDLYERSEAARDIWDRGDKYMSETYGVSVLDIVKRNPRHHTIHFTGDEGARIRDNYIGLVPGITRDTLHYTFSSGSGLLDLTQIIQPVLILFDLAIIADMRENGLVQKPARFAGHSFGEFAAVCAISNIFSLEDTLDLIFYRGLVLELAAECDERGNSEYRMAAVNPSRVDSKFTVNDLVSSIEAIKDHSHGLLELINHNIEGQQYIITGTISQLKILSVALDRIREGGNVNKKYIVDAAVYATNQISIEKIQNGEIKLGRCSVLVPIENVHVPSHSSRMLSFVEPFRHLLLKKLNGKAVDPDILCLQYIPNVIGTPFEISRDYFSKVYNATNSIDIKDFLDKWDDTWVNDSAKKQQLAKILFIELITNQIACPVQWISTQQYLLGDNGPERMIEIGPGPILSDMMKRSARQKDTRVDILPIVSEMDKIYFHSEFMDLDKPKNSASDTSINNTLTEVPVQANIESTVALSNPSLQAVSAPVHANTTESFEPVPDIVLTPLYIIRVIIAQKLRKPLNSVVVDKSIESLSGGKSTLRNEIVGDLKREFGTSGLDTIEDLTIEEIADLISPFSGSLGPYTESQLFRILRNKLPGGFNKSSVYSYFESVYGISSVCCDGVLLLALVNNPDSRFSSSSDVNLWLDTLVAEYANIHGFVLSKSNKTVNSGSVSTRALTSADIQALEKAQIGHHQLSTHIIEALANSIGVNLRKGDRKAEDLAEKHAKLQNSYDNIVGELGEEFINGLKPVFSSLKARYFDSYWNWARQDLLELFYNLAAGKIDINSIYVSEKVMMLKNRSTPALLEFLSFCIKRLGYDLESLSVDDTNAAFFISLYSECKESLNKSPKYASYRVPQRPHTTVTDSGDIVYSEAPSPGISTRNEYIDCVSADRDDGYPLLFVKTNTGNNSWEYDTEVTKKYLDALAAVYSDGVTFSNKRILLTGCGRYSIGEEILKGLLSGGAKVVATTSSYNRKTMLYFEDMYRQYGSRGSELVVVPFNQGSVEDVRSLIQFIYNSPTNGGDGLGWELDLVIPFAAISNNYGDITQINSYAELSHRVLLTNIIRLLGEISIEHSKQKSIAQVTQVVVPLSPNNGQLGNDGSYSESKIGLEALMRRWYSEPWAKYISIIGVSIGWTRETGLVRRNGSIISEGFEKSGIYTFTTGEIAAGILCAVSNTTDISNYIGSIRLDLSGRFDTTTYLGDLFAKLRNEIIDKAHDISAINKATLLESSAINGIEFRKVRTPAIKPRSNYRMDFPEYKSYEDLEHLHYMQGMVNLDKVVVVTGFGEVSSYGSSSTRWEMEAYGEFSLEGCIELAWVMGYISFFSGTLKSTGNQYTGWVDSKTGDPVDDIDVKARYEKHILEHSGIRLIEPELHDGYDPNKKFFMRELQIEHDMDPFEASKEEADQFKLQNGDNVEISQNDNGMWSVRFLKGAIIMVPKALQFDRTVAAQVPTGWDPVRYGIPEEIAKQADPVTWYGLVATVEALLRSGITDPYELYNYIHITKLGTTVGSALAGRQYLAKSYTYPLIDKDLSNDALQEMTVGIVPAWSNMLLFSSSGPIKPVAAACATSLVSIDVAVETIQSGKASVMVSGGVDGFDGQSAYMFGQIGATRNSLEDFSHGRTPAELCRPCTSTRNGFVEGEGSGIMILMSASTAIKVGAPIYGIISHSSTASDKIGRSVPAPGQGILSTACKSIQTTKSNLLDFDFRKKHLGTQLQFIEKLQSSVNNNSKIQMMRKAAQDEWGNEFWKGDESISPLCGSLAVWGLDIDDIGVVSFHGTSTIANDLNESEIFNLQFKHSGRTPGNTVPVIAQKWLTGHSKGAAASLMANGMLQVLGTGLIPGNRNADNIERKFEKFEYLVYPSKSIQTSGIKAGLLKSFGFGQVGGELLIVHPDYVLATLSKDELERYQENVKEREKKAYRYWHNTFVGNHTFVQVKDDPPYTKEQEKDILLNLDVRIKYNPKSKKYHF